MAAQDAILENRNCEKSRSSIFPEFPDLDPLFALIKFTFRVCPKYHAHPKSYMSNSTLPTSNLPNSSARWCDVSSEPFLPSSVLRVRWWASSRGCHLLLLQLSGHPFHVWGRGDFFLGDACPFWIWCFGTWSSRNCLILLNALDRREITSGELLRIPSTWNWGGPRVRGGWRSGSWGRVWL